MKFSGKMLLVMGQIDHFPSLFRIKLFSFSIHILHSSISVRVFISIVLSNIARIVFEKY